MIYIPNPFHSLGGFEPMKRIITLVAVATALGNAPQASATDTISSFVRDTLDPIVDELQRANGLPHHTAMQVIGLTGSIAQRGSMGASINSDTRLPGNAYVSIGAGWSPIFAPRVVYLAKNCQALYKQLGNNRDLLKQRLTADYIVGLSMILDLFESGKMKTVRRRGKIGEKIYLAKDLPVMRSVVTPELMVATWATAAQATVPLMESVDASNLPRGDVLRDAYLLHRKHASRDEWKHFLVKCNCTASL